MLARVSIRYFFLAKKLFLVFRFSFGIRFLCVYRVGRVRRFGGVVGCLEFLEAMSFEVSFFHSMLLRSSIKLYNSFISTISRNYVMVCSSVKILNL